MYITLHYLTLINISKHYIEYNPSSVLESNHYFVLLYPVIISRVRRHVFHKPEVEADDDDHGGDDDHDDQVYILEVSLFNPHKKNMQMFWSQHKSSTVTIYCWPHHISYIGDLPNCFDGKKGVNL